MEKLLAELRKLAAKHDPNYDPGEYWTSGNFDDCFEDGRRYGNNMVYGEIKELLEEFEKK